MLMRSLSLTSIVWALPSVLLPPLKMNASLSLVMTTV